VKINCPRFKRLHLYLNESQVFFTLKHRQKLHGEKHAAWTSEIKDRSKFEQESSAMQRRLSVRFGAVRSRVRPSAGSYQDRVNWYCSLLARRTVCGRAAGNTPRTQEQAERNELSRGATTPL